MLKFIVVFSMLLLYSISDIKGQSLYIQNGNRKIKIIEGSFLDVKTWDDSIEFPEIKKHSAFEINKMTFDSIEIRRSTGLKDTFRYKFNIWTGQDIKNKKQFYKVPSGYEYKRYALKDLSRLKYTFQHDQSGSGCIACIFVPGLNIYYFWSKSRRTKVFNIKEWKFIWK
jgi:hypothetical protein